MIHLFDNVTSLEQNKILEEEFDNTELEFLEKVEFAFLTSTLREVQAIETVNGVMLPLVSSPIIKKIKCEFDRISTSDQDP